MEKPTHNQKTGQKANLVPCHTKTHRIIVAMSQFRPRPLRGAK